MYFLQGLILGLNIIQILLIITFGVLRKRTPFAAHILAFLIIILAIVDAITREFLWPLGMMFGQIVILIMLNVFDRKWDQLETIRQNQRWRETVDGDYIRETHINRTLDKETE